MSGRIVWGLTLWMVAWGVAAGQAGEPAVRSPIPSASAQAESRKLVTGFFGDTVAKAKTAQDRTQLAKKMLQGGIDEQSDRGFRYVMFSLAGETAADAADIETTITAVETIAKYFDADLAKLKLDALSRLEKARGVDAGALGELYTQLIDESVAADRYDMARKAADGAMGLAKRTGQPQDLQAAATRQKDVSAIQASYEPAKKALAVLASDSNNTAAYLTAGRFLCLAKGDWAKGLPMLANGSDKPLKRAADKELQNPTASNEQVELGDAWWDLSAKEPEPARRKMREHAVEWYLKALPDLTGAGKLKVHLRLEEVKPAEAIPRWTVIFRSDDPTIWNTDTNDGRDSIAMPLSKVPRDVKYVRITSLAKKACVIVAAGADGLDKEEGGAGRYRWNGGNKFEFGAHHLGAIDMQGGTGSGKVEVSYGRIGWGFGHLYEANDRQAWAWAGVPMEKSVFEIAVTSSPRLSGQDKKALLGGLAAGGKVHSVWRRPGDGAWFVLYQDQTFKHYNTDFSPRDGGWDKGSWRVDAGQTFLTSSTGAGYEFLDAGEMRTIRLPAKSWPRAIATP